jgi:hypothetical protein
MDRKGQVELNGNDCKPLLRGGITDLNAALGNVFFYNSMLANTTLTIEVNDGNTGGTGAGGARTANKVVNIVSLDIPLQFVQFDKTGLAIEVGFTKPIALSTAAVAALKTNGGGGSCEFLFAAAARASFGSAAECLFVPPQTLRVATGRGLHSSTFQLNLSRFWHKMHPMHPLILLNTS